MLSLPVLLVFLLASTKLFREIYYFRSRHPILVLRFVSTVALLGLWIGDGTDDDLNDGSNDGKTTCTH